jgi:hypothetical protein
MPSEIPTTKTVTLPLVWLERNADYQSMLIGPIEFGTIFFDSRQNVWFAASGSWLDFTFSRQHTNREDAMADLENAAQSMGVKNERS